MASEYLCELVRQAKKCKAKERLQGLLLEALNSGEPITVTPEYWERKRASLMANYRKTREILSELCRSGVGEYVFTNHETGTHFVEVRKAFKSACHAACIEDFNFHDLRHTFGTRLADAGVNVVKIKDLMGHASITTTMRYMHASEKGKREAIAKLSNYRKRGRCRIVALPTERVTVQGGE